MEQKAIKFLLKENVKPSDILYFLHHDRKTVLYLVDGRCLETYIPVKYLLAALPSHSFLNITKGVVVSAAAIYKIEGATYTMTDGQQFIGRKRGAGEHKLNRQRLETRFASDNPHLSQTIAERFSILDQSPLPCYVVQLVSNSSGYVTDFVFRYGNRAMYELENLQEETFLGHSFYDVQKDWSHRWLAIYTDVALNGTKRVIPDYSRKLQCPVTIYCYQPMENYCVCCLVPGTVEDGSSL